MVLLFGGVKSMRTTNGAATHKSKRRLFKKVKGYRGGRGKLTRTAKETLVRAALMRFVIAEHAAGNFAACGSFG